MHDTAVAKVSTPVFKVTGPTKKTTFTHKSNLHELPDEKRIWLAQALRVAGEFEYDIARIAFDGSYVCLLRYPSFDTQAHPALKYSIKVMLPSGQICITDYSTQANPPILHRKDTLVGTKHPHYRKFHALTLAEEKHGLLTRHDISTKLQWKALLKSKNLTINGHSLSQIQ